MKAIYLFASILFLLCLTAYAQQVPSINYMSSIKNYDLSVLWRASSIITHDADGIINRKPVLFPEPLGYIGINYHRFYIHYTSVKKDTINPYRYFVRGKTRVENQICDFSGTIIINKAVMFKQSDDPRFKEGRVVCDVYFKEDSSQIHSGYIKGQLVSDWCLDKNQRLLYDAINFVGDGYCNNQCIANWTSYTTKRSKPCNWGDFRMPKSEKLDSGVGDISINDQYVKNGWQSYVNVYSGDQPTKRKAIIEENRKWWK